MQTKKAKPYCPVRTCKYKVLYERGIMNELRNNRYGKLVVIEFSHKIKRNKGSYRYFWLCKCDCGNFVVVNGDKLISGHTKSCGCLVKEKTRQMHSSHNLSKTRLYKIYHGILKRCENKNSTSFKNYGKKNIKVCKEWKDDFIAFYNWAINNGYQDKLTIDRINVRGNYEPSNCRWATAEIQQNNRSNNLHLTHKNKTLTLAEWCKELNLNYFTVQQRLNKLNWSVSRALNTPTQKGYIKNEYR